jgi:hypothetical protein
MIPYEVANPSFFGIPSHPSLIEPIKEAPKETTLDLFQ